MAIRISTMDLLSLDSAGFQKRLDAGLITSVQLVQACLAQIDKHDQRHAKLNAMISIVPYQLLMERSKQLDRERAAGRVRSLFHGIPILIKDAIAISASLGLATTIGSLALKQSITSKSASIVSKLEDMGVIVLGKANLNEFCNFKGYANSNGWSAVGGQTQSAYLPLAPNEIFLGQSDPAGSSTGSAVGVSAGYAPLALGTESVGSIVMPACRAGLYALKPTLNSVYMDGVFKTSAELDVVGGLTRSASDLASLSYCALTQEKQDLLPKGGYHKYLTKNFDSLRIGFLDPTKWSLHPDIVQLDKVILQQMNDMYVAMVDRVRDHAAETSVKYPVDLPPASDLWYEGRDPIDILVSYEGKQALEDWLSELQIEALKTIEDVIKFNIDHRGNELPHDHPDQEQLLRASRDRPSQDTYEAAKQHMTAVSKVDGIDKLFREQNLNLLAFPQDSLMIYMSAASGYPIANVPVGVIEADGRPYGIGVMAQAGREDLMFQFMSALEEYLPPRAMPSRVQGASRKQAL